MAHVTFSSSSVLLSTAVKEKSNMLRCAQSDDSVPHIVTFLMGPLLDEESKNVVVRVIGSPIPHAERLI